MLIRMTRILFLLLLLPGVSVGANPADQPSVGMEGRVSVTIPGPRLEIGAQGRNPDVLLRIATAEPVGDAFRYEFSYTGMLPGEHNLADYLVLPDGTPPEGIEPIMVEVAGALPVGHHGFLSRIKMGRIHVAKWYREVLAGVFILWLLALVPLVYYKRRRKPPEPAPAAPAPTLAERLQPLVLKAADGTLTVGEKARLEGLMLSFWREKLELDAEDMTASLELLKKDEAAGELLRAIEAWLHKPKGADQARIAELLAPYETISSND